MPTTDPSIDDLQAELDAANERIRTMNERHVAETQRLQKSVSDMVHRFSPLAERASDIAGKAKSSTGEVVGGQVADLAQAMSAAIAQAHGFDPNNLTTTEGS